VGTTNVDFRAPTYPPFIVALREREPTDIHDRRPRSGRGSDRFPDPEITFLTPWTSGRKAAPSKVLVTVAAPSGASPTWSLQRWSPMFFSRAHVSY
jgi:hypothetical protein